MSEPFLLAHAQEALALWVSGPALALRPHGHSDPRRCPARSYAIISGWTRSWLWRGWTKPLPHPDVLARAGEDAEAIFGLTQMEKIQFDSEARSPVAAARELLDRVVSRDPSGCPPPPPLPAPVSLGLPSCALCFLSLRPSFCFTVRPRRRKARCWLQGGDADEARRVLKAELARL